MSGGQVVLYKIDYPLEGNRTYFASKAEAKAHYPKQRPERIVMDRDSLADFLNEWLRLHRDPHSS